MNIRSSVQRQNTESGISGVRWRGECDLQAAPNIQFVQLWEQMDHVQFHISKEQTAYLNYNARDMLFYNDEVEQHLYL
jgi:hypothetical protein